ncbi:TPA: plasmid IncI1-type surface exclusion protein ExcA [Salmonella enterica]|nr:plasmid IncI1-type surface exclusion protein ExcA [Salmonella enterica]
MKQIYIDPYHYNLLSRIKGVTKGMLLLLGLPALTIWTLIIWSVASSESRYPQAQAQDWNSFTLSFIVLMIFIFILVVVYTHSKKNMKTIITAVKLEGVFEPCKSNELIGFFNSYYFGIDIVHGTFVYIEHVNTKENLLAKDIMAFGFDVKNWRSCELSDNKLTVYTNDPNIPYIYIDNKRAPLLFEKISAMRNKDFSYPHSFPGWVDIKAQEAAEARGLNLIPIKY